TIHRVIVNWQTIMTMARMMRRLANSDSILHCLACVQRITMRLTDCCFQSLLLDSHWIDFDYYRLHLGLESKTKPCAAHIYSLVCAEGIPPGTVTVPNWPHSVAHTQQRERQKAACVCTRAQLATFGPSRSSRLSALSK